MAADADQVDNAEQPAGEYGYLESGLPVPLRGAVIYRKLSLGSQSEAGERRIE